MFFKTKRKLIKAINYLKTLPLLKYEIGTKVQCCSFGGDKNTGIIVDKVEPHIVGRDGYWNDCKEGRYTIYSKKSKFECTDDMIIKEIK